MTDEKRKRGRPLAGLPYIGQALYLRLPPETWARIEGGTPKELAIKIEQIIIDHFSRQKDS